MAPEPALTIMLIGEKQSELVDVEKCLFMPNGEVYENRIKKLLGTPLDTGRLFYAKLRYAFPRNVEVEVLWDHFHNELIGMVKGRDFEYFVDFVDPVMARTDKVVYIEQIVDSIKGAAPSLQ